MQCKYSSAATSTAIVLKDVLVILLSILFVVRRLFFSIVLVVNVSVLLPLCLMFTVVIALFLNDRFSVLLIIPLLCFKICLFVRIPLFVGSYALSATNHASTWMVFIS